MRRSNPVVLALVALSLFSPGASGQSLEKFEKRVTEATLSNGIRVILVERHAAPVASFVNHVDVGSVNEVPGITGLAHLLEHMAFKGTHVIGTTDYEAEKVAMARVDELYQKLQKARRQDDEQRVAELEAAFAEAQEEAGSYVVPNEFGRIIEREGGQGLNARTSPDNTVYYVSLPSNKVELWAYLESERHIHGVLREFYRERNVVMEERRMGERSPRGRLGEQFEATAYTAHPYGQPVIGHMSDLQSLTREDARAFSERHYIPQNMTIAIVGDIEPQKTLELLQTYFGRIEPGPDPEPVRTVEPRVPAERTVTLYDPAQPWYFVGYPIPSIRDADYPALMALWLVMSDGRTSRLHRRLVSEQQIASFASAIRGAHKYPCLLTFYATAAPGHTNDEIAVSIETEIARIKTQLVSGEELEGAKAKFRASLIRQLDSNGAMAGGLAYWQATTGDWRNLFRYRDRIQDLKAEDLRRVANEYLNNRYRTVGRIETVSEELPGGTQGRRP